jgi:hypothetical protein
MTKKICSTCKEDKEVCEFSPDKSKKSGVSGQCRICKSIYDKKRYLMYSDNFKKKSKDYYENNKEKVIITNKIWTENNSEKRKQIAKEWVKNNPSKHKESQKKYKLKNKTIIKIKSKVYNSENRDKQRLYEKQKRETDILFKLRSNVRSRLRMFLKSKNITKNNSTFNLVGCSPEFLKEHLEKQFVKEMSWDNYGIISWHIDHIKPLSSAQNEEELKKLCHYTNLQPLWAKDNLEKSNKIVY